MAPARSGQLDQISEAIGRLEGKFDGVDRYIHERQHDIKDVSAKIDALGHAMSKEMAAVEARMEVRLKALELGQNSISTAKQISIWIVQTIVTIVAAAAAVLTLGHSR